MSDLAELFTRDPLSLTTDDIDTIIKYFREQRHQYNLGIAAAPTKKQKPIKITSLDGLLDL